MIPFTVEHIWFFLPKSTTNRERVDSCPVSGAGEWCPWGWGASVRCPVDESVRQAGRALCGPETGGQEVGRTDTVLHHQCSRRAPTDQHLEESGLAGQWKNQVKVTTCTAEFRDDLLSSNFIERSKYFVLVQVSGSWAIKLDKLDKKFYLSLTFTIHVLKICNGNIRLRPKVSLSKFYGPRSKSLHLQQRFLEIISFFSLIQQMK